MDSERYLAAFGQVLAERRRQKGLSQEALAHVIGLHRTYVGSVERGERNCTLTTLLALSDGLDCLPEELLADARRSAAER